MPSIFLEEGKAPLEEDLRESLGEVWGAWQGLLAGLEGLFGDVDRRWSFGGKKYGWSLRTSAGKLSLVYLIPGNGQFVASMALGEKPCALARESGLPAALLELIELAPKFPEGKAVKLEVRGHSDVPPVLALVRLKRKQ